MHSVKNFHELSHFKSLFHTKDSLLNIFVYRDVMLAYLNVLRIFGAEIPRQFLNISWPSSREVNCLPIHSNVFYDFSHIFFEVHIEHPISFIKDQIRNSIQVCHPLIQEILKPARTGYNYIWI